MSTRASGCLAVCAWIAIATASEPSGAASDEIVRRAFIPSEKNVHGELRLIRRDGATCAQTLLYSPALRRGLQRIRRKELQHWPEGSEGFADSRSYLEALDAAGERVLERFEEREVKADRRQKMLIEFVLGEEDAFFAIYGVEIEDAEGEVRIIETFPLEVREASRAYVGRAIRLMQDSAFPTPGE